MESHQNEPGDDRPFHYRPHLIVVFAIVMVWLAANAQADQVGGEMIARLAAETLSSPVQGDVAGSSSDQVMSLMRPMNTIQWDATYVLPSGHSALWKRDGNRPVSVELSSSLANFDADAMPDGWRASVVIRDRDASPVVMQSAATFTLVPRVPLSGHRRFMDSDTQTMTWSMQLRFDERGVANVTLPLRRSLQASFGWSSASSRFPFDSVRSRSRNHDRFRGGNIAVSRVYSGHHQRTVGGVSYTRADVPSIGVMRVRVNVPTEGVFEAETPVRLRRSSFVNPAWPGFR